jgi:DNA primase
VGGFLNEFEKDDVKRRIDIVTLFEHFGVRLTKKGKSHTGHCPWHDDNTPSLSVDKEKGLYNCFGCGESGDHFSLVMKMKGYEFKEALAYLKNFIGTVDVVPPEIPGKKKTSVKKLVEKPVIQTGEQQTRDRKTPTESDSKTESLSEKTSTPPDTKKTPDEKTKPPAKTIPVSDGKTDNHTHTTVTLDMACDYYYKKLYKNNTAMNYLVKTRRIGQSLLGRFKIGFSDNSLMNMVSNGQKEAFKTLGILKTTDTGRIWEFFAGCLTFPIFDDVGNVIPIAASRNQIVGANWISNTMVYRKREVSSQESEFSRFFV